MHRRSLLLRPFAPLAASLLAILGNVTACLSDNAGTLGAAGGLATSGAGPIAGVGGSSAMAGIGGGGAPTTSGSSGSSATVGGTGGAAVVAPKICDSSLEAEAMEHSTGEAV